MTEDNLLDDERLDVLLKGVKLPPQPEVMIELYRHLACPEPDIAAVAGTIENDLGLSASVLKTANSPFFGMRRRIDTIAGAVTLLGMRNVVHIVSCEALRRSMCDDHVPGIDRLFDRARGVAAICAAVAREYRTMAPDRAYTLGLFHDCGLPLMLRKFPDYADFLASAEPGSDKTIIDLENERYQTNHAVVGFWICRTWGLPEEIGEVVAQHHRADELLAGRTLPESGDKEHSGLVAGVATVALAEAVICSISAQVAVAAAGPVRPEVLAFFEMDEREYELFCEEVRDQVQA